MADGRVIAIVLAGQRHGVVNPLAERAGVSHKCLVPIGGKPLMAHVLAALASLPDIAEIRISVEPAAEPELRPLVAPYEASGPAIRFVPIGEAMVALVLADHYLRQRGQRGSSGG